MGSMRKYGVPFSTHSNLQTGSPRSISRSKNSAWLCNKIRSWELWASNQAANTKHENYGKKSRQKIINHKKQTQHSMKPIQSPPNLFFAKKQDLFVSKLISMVTPNGCWTNNRGKTLLKLNGWFGGKTYSYFWKHPNTKLLWTDHSSPNGLLWSGSVWWNGTIHISFCRRLVRFFLRFLGFLLYQTEFCSLSNHRVSIALTLEPPKNHLSKVCHPIFEGLHMESRKCEGIFLSWWLARISGEGLVFTALGRCFREVLGPCNNGLSRIKFFDWSGFHESNWFSNLMAFVTWQLCQPKHIAGPNPQLVSTQLLWSFLFGTFVLLNFAFGLIFTPRFEKSCESCLSQHAAAQKRRGHQFWTK